MTLTAASAGAQSYSDDRDSYVANERVIVTAPPTYGRGSTTGAPIRDVAFSREVRIDDLDLHTRWGQRALYGRIHATARSLCRKLDMMYPVSADNNPDCYRTAVDNAMAQAYDMIGDNRD
jgi:UrcA family protein